MAKVLKITYGEITLFDGEPGKFNWSETAGGGITVTAEPARAPGQTNPALQMLAEQLKNASKAGRKQAEDEAAAKAAS